MKKMERPRCYQCGQEFIKRNDGIRYLHFALSRLFATVEECLVYFTIDETDDIDLSSTFICHLCINKVKARTVAVKGDPIQRKLKKTAAGQVLTCRDEDSQILDEHNYQAEVQKTLEMLREQNRALIGSNTTGCVKVEAEHSNLVPTDTVGDGGARNFPLLRATLGKKVPESMKALIPGCYQCGQNFVKGKKAYLRCSLARLFATAEECLVYFRIDETDDIDLSTTFICHLCISKVKARTFPVRGTRIQRKLKKTGAGLILTCRDEDDVILDEDNYRFEVQKTLEMLCQKNRTPIENNTVHGTRDFPLARATFGKNLSRFSARRIATNAIGQGKYGAAFRSLVRHSKGAKQSLVNTFCWLLRKEKKKLLEMKDEVYFSKAVTAENVNDLSLEEAAIQANEISPIIVQCLKSLLPSPEHKQYKSEEYGEKVINTRLAFILGVALYTNRPRRFKYIPTCMGMKILDEDVSYNALKWLSDAGVIMTRASLELFIKRIERRQHGVTETDQSATNTEKQQASADQLEVSETPAPSKGQPVKFPLRTYHACPLCPRRFNRRSELVAHKIVHSTARPFVCQACGNAYKIPSALRNHTSRCREFKLGQSLHDTTTEETEPAVPIKMDLTGEEPKTLEPSYSRLFEPTKYTDSRMEYPCTKCSKVLMSRTTLQRHLKEIHAAHRSYMCSICERTFTSEKECQVHEARHDEAVTMVEKLFEVNNAEIHSPMACEICRKVLSGKRNLVKHMRSVHFANRPYTCPVCEKTFTSEEDCSEHQTKAHEEAQAVVENIQVSTSEEGFACTVCGQVLACKTTLLDHVNAVHDTGNPVTCPVCLMIFGTFTKCLEHQGKEHSGVTKSPQSSARMKKSTRKHTADSSQPTKSAVDTSDLEKKGFLCKTCGRVMSTKTLLNRHERVVHGPRPYVCDLCDKAFATIPLLEGHRNRATHARQRIRKKTTKKPAEVEEEDSRDDIDNAEGAGPIDEGQGFLCMTCGCVMSTKKKLTQHERCVHAPRPYVCDLCAKAFMTRKLLEQHRNKIHVERHRKRKQRKMKPAEEEEDDSAESEGSGPESEGRASSSLAKKNNKRKHRAPVESRKPSVQTEAGAAVTNILADWDQGDDIGSNPMKKQCLTEVESNPYELLSQLSNHLTNAPQQVRSADMDCSDVAETVTVEEGGQVDGVIVLTE